MNVESRADSRHPEGRHGPDIFGDDVGDALVDGVEQLPFEMSDRPLVEPPDEKGVAPSKLADENVADFRRCDASSLGTVGTRLRSRRLPTRPRSSPWLPAGQRG